MRALACFPLITGGAYDGVFYVHFWRRHTFSDDEIELLEFFADQASVAMQDAQVYERLRMHNQALASLAMIGQSLAGVLDPTTLLPMIAHSARTVLDADIVTIYEYNHAEANEVTFGFHTPPTIDGRLNRSDLMQTTIDRGDAQWMLVHRIGKSIYEPDTRKQKVLHNPDRPHPHREGGDFVEREKIVSSAGILLKARKEVVGVMFINYRRRRDFSTTDRRLIENLASFAAIAIHTARTASRQRAASAKLADLGSISISLHHRMGDPMAAIGPLAQQIRNRIADDDYVRAKTTEIEQSANEALDIIRRLSLPFKPSEMSVTSLNDAVQKGQLAAITREYMRQIKVATEYSLDAPKVVANPDQLAEVFRNLVRNAIEAFPVDGGTISVGTRINRAGWVEAWVLDNGIGIPRDLGPRVFRIWGHWPD